jgi:hypothetical protein
MADGLAYRPFGGPSGMDNGTDGMVNNQSGECGCLEVANPGNDMETFNSYDANRNLIVITATNHERLNRTFGYGFLIRLISATSFCKEIPYMSMLAVMEAVEKAHKAISEGLSF